MATVIFKYLGSEENYLIDPETKLKQSLDWEEFDCGKCGKKIP